MSKVYFVEKHDSDSIKKIAKAVFDEQKLDKRRVNFDDPGVRQAAVK